jgi:hypothetical protein
MQRVTTHDANAKVDTFNARTFAVSLNGGTSVQCVLESPQQPHLLVSAPQTQTAFRAAFVWIPIRSVPKVSADATWDTLRRVDSAVRSYTVYGTKVTDNPNRPQEKSRIKM